MRRVSASVFILLIFLCANIFPAYSQVGPPAITPAPGLNPQVKTLDVNKDGQPDIIYHRDGEYVSKVEADTNFDGKPDITVNVKGGKFESAKVDSNYDGKVEKKFTNEDAFKKWLNQNRPDFADKLDKKDWRFNALTF